MCIKFYIHLFVVGKYIYYIILYLSLYISISLYIYIYGGGRERGGARGELGAVDYMSPPLCKLWGLDSGPQDSDKYLTLLALFSAKEYKSQHHFF